MAATPPTSFPRKPVPGLAALEKAAIDAFGTIINPSAASLVSTIQRASYFAVPDQDGTSDVIVLDRRAFLLGLLEFGLAEPRRHSTSAWLIQWLGDDLGHGFDQVAQIVARHDRAAANTSMHSAGAPLILSESMRALFPGAAELARDTVDRDRIDLRHLFVAFLFPPGSEWDVLPRRPTSAQLVRLLRRIVDEIAKHPETNEDVETWRMLVSSNEPNPAMREADTGSISVEPGGTLFIDAGALEAMRDAFLARFPDFADKGFDVSEGGYWETERAYKQALIDGAAGIMGQTELAPPQVGAALLELLKDCNLLGWREWRRMEEVEDKALIPAALGEMVAADDPAEGVGQFVASVAGDYLKGREGNMPYADLRSIPTTVLALARPADAIAVRYTTMHRAGVRLTGGSLFKNAPMTAHEYRVVLTIARHIEKVMRDAWGWRPRDLWDVQGFLWVVTEGPEADAEAEADGGIDDVALEATADTPQEDRYRTQTDDPAREDALERKPFARVLAQRIVEIRTSARGAGADDDRAFMVHVHGPWGSGKSSMLNLLQAQLEEPGKQKPPWPEGEEPEPALVVWFNAWKHQRMRPPWWALLSTVYRAAVKKCYEIGSEPQRNAERRALQKLWLRWRLRADWGALLIVAAVLIGILGLAAASGTVQLITAGAGALGVAAAIYTYARPALFGSAKAAQTYTDLTTDPYSPVVKLFGDLVARIKPPLVIFIDDLDRCDSDYVVELLEGIQTLFRGAPVTYVVAAERKWICSSFEKKYGDFSIAIGEPCRPLGYLFLDKLFQISAGMPQLTPELKALYLGTLLGEAASETVEPSPEQVKDAAKTMAGKSDEAEIQKVLDESRDKPVAEQRALRHAGALQISSAEAVEKTEYRLKKLSHLLEPNPRSMKRLLNAVAMAQARGMLEGRTATPETRARWAMLSLRWPVLADFVADNPAAISHWKGLKPGTGRRSAKPNPRWPAAVQELSGNAAVMAVVGGDGDEGALTPQSLAPLLG